MDRRRTILDQLDRLELAYPKTEHPRAEQAKKVAVRTVYQALPLKHDWTHLRRACVIQTVDQVEVTVDIESGVATRTDSTWPTWAGMGTLFIESERYDAVERMSGTELRLDPNQTPEDEDGVSAILVQQRYALPADFGEATEVTRQGGTIRLNPLPGDSRGEALAFYVTPGSPQRYAIGGIRGAALLLELYGPPSSAEPIRVSYRSYMRQLSPQGFYNKGVVSIVGSTATISGTGAAWPDRAAGMILRLGSSDKEPTSDIGPFPAIEAYTVLRRESATELILAETSSTFTTVRFMLDDPLDIDPHAQGEYFDRACEAEFERMVRLPTAPQADQTALAALRRAKEQDYRITSVGRAPANVNFLGGL